VEGIGEFVDLRIVQKLPEQLPVEPAALDLTNETVLKMHFPTGEKTSVTIRARDDPL